MREGVEEGRREDDGAVGVAVAVAVEEEDSVVL